MFSDSSEACCPLELILVVLVALSIVDRVVQVAESSRMVKTIHV